MDNLEKVLHSLVEEVKEYLHIVNNDDDTNLHNLIKRGYATIESMCGVFDLEKDVEGRSLVIEWVRFHWLGAGEHFEDSYQCRIDSFAWKLEGAKHDSKENKNSTSI